MEEPQEVPLEDQTKLDLQDIFGTCHGECELCYYGPRYLGKKTPCKMKKGEKEA